MKHPLYLALVPVLLPTALCATFENPQNLPISDYPPTRDTDFSKNPIYTEGSNLNIRWSKGEEDIPTSITLYQIKLPIPEGDDVENLDYLILPQEYVFQSVVKNTDFTWVVKTGHDLSKSNVFMMSLFQEGSTTGSGNSQYFNISSGRDEEKPSSSSSSTSISSSTSSASLSVAPASQTSASASTTSPPSSETTPAAPTSPPTSSSGLSTGAKIGIGLGIPALIALGLALGFVLFRRRRQHEPIPQLKEGVQGVQAHEMHSAPYTDTQYKGYYGKGSGGPMQMPHYSHGPGVELEAGHGAELEAGRQVHEMDSGVGGHR